MGQGTTGLTAYSSTLCPRRLSLRTKPFLSPHTMNRRHPPKTYPPLRSTINDQPAVTGCHLQINGARFLIRDRPHAVWDGAPPAGSRGRSQPYYNGYGAKLIGRSQACHTSTQFVQTALFLSQSATVAPRPPSSFLVCLIHFPSQVNHPCLECLASCRAGKSPAGSLLHRVRRDSLGEH